MRARPFLPLVPILALLLWTSPAQPQATEDLTSVAARLEGTWVLTISRDEGRRVVDRAIEAAVSEMNFFVRPVASSQLRENTPINQRIDLRFEGERITVGFDRRHSYQSRVGRPRTVRTPDGEELRLTQRVRSGQLEQVFQAGEGTRWNLYQSTGEGRMRVSATTQGMMMPSPMHFTFDYRRQ